MLISQIKTPLFYKMYKGILKESYGKVTDLFSKYVVAKNR